MTFGKQISPLQRADIPELSRFLSDGFAVGADSAFCSPAVLEWKYFDGPGGPSGDSVRSHVARSAGEIVGHIGICYRQLVVSGEEAAPVSTLHAIDWLGSAAHPGVGMFLMLETFAASKTQFAVAATSQAQTLFPRLGYEQKPKVALFRKVLAPLHRLRRTDLGVFQRWAGTALDIVSASRARTLGAPRAIELRPVAAFTEETDTLLRQSPLRVVMCRRDHSRLNYLLRYPLSGFSGWSIHRPERTIGFAVLKITPCGSVRRGRIVECWLDSDDEACWHAAVAALVDCLRGLSASDVACYATTPLLRAALLHNGFAKSKEQAVYVRDKQQLLRRDLPFALSEFDADGAIL